MQKLIENGGEGSDNRIIAWTAIMILFVVNYRFGLNITRTFVIIFRCSEQCNNIVGIWCRGNVNSPPSILWASQPLIKLCWNDTNFSDRAEGKLGESWLVNVGVCPPQPHCHSVIKEKFTCKGSECPPTDDNMTRERERERERRDWSDPNMVCRTLSVLYSVFVSD